jgi:aldose 1-epimerase
MLKKDITSTLYDRADGKDIFLITLRNGMATIRVTNIGCSIISIDTPDREGIFKNIVAGFADPLDYLHNPWYFGCIVGRYVNRIGNGMYHLEGQTVRLSRNEGSNHLHGGFEGFHKKIWEMKELVDGDRAVSLLFEYTSPDGEEGYPGNLKVQMKYSLFECNRLELCYTAVTDKPTPVNLSNHSYFNLTGFDSLSILDHRIMINAVGYTEKNGQNLPTGNILSLEGTPLDLTGSVRLGDRVDKNSFDKGFDHNYVLGRVGPAAEVYDPFSGRVLRVLTDRPGIQLYTANWWDGSVRGSHDMPYQQHGAFALETQAFPDSPNRPEFPNTILAPGELYSTRTIYEFDIK